MGASFSDRFYIAAPQGVAAKLSSMLLAAQIMPSGVVHTGMEAVRAAQGGAMLLTTYRLPDMTGEELARQLGEEADVVMIVPQDYAGEETENVVMLRNPISADALVQSVKTLAHCRIRMQQLRAKAEKLARTLEERTGRPVTLWDERRTTVDAHNIPVNNGKNAKKRKKVVDAVAASLMLEGYLTRKRLEAQRHE